MRAVTGAGVAVALGVILAGCQASSNPATSASPSLRGTPVENFSARAESLWEAYFAQYTRALSDPQFQLDDLKPYLTADEYDFIEKRISAIRSEKVRVRGKLLSRNFTVVDASAMTALVCLDGSGSQVVNAHGDDVTPTDRPETSTIRLIFANSGGRLLLDRDESWTKSSAC